MSQSVEFIRESGGKLSSSRSSGCVFGSHYDYKYNLKYEVLLFARFSFQFFSKNKNTINPVLIRKECVKTV